MTIDKATAYPLTKMKHMLTSAFEKASVCSVLCMPVMHVACLIYRPIVRKEIQRFRITSRDRVLFIGGGALPYSAYLIHQMTRARVDVVDIDEQAYRYARHLATKHYPRAFYPYHKCGTQVDPTQYDVVIIARQVDNKKQVIKHLRSYKSFSRLLVRENLWSESME